MAGKQNTSEANLFWIVFMDTECPVMPTTIKRVLIIEDDPDTSSTLAEMLRESGYRVLTAVDRDEGLSILESNQVDTVLLDYMMPGQSASRFLYRVRSAYPNLRIVLATAANRVDAVARMLGITEYIAKPIIPDKLLQILESPA
jgi:CheY-like chemotaxis protein